MNVIEEIINPDGKPKVSVSSDNVLSCSKFGVSRSVYGKSNIDLAQSRCEVWIRQIPGPCGCSLALPNCCSFSGSQEFGSRRTFLDLPEI